jgi:hypothetical protein
MSILKVGSDTGSLEVSDGGLLSLTDGVKTLTLDLGNMAGASPFLLGVPLTPAEQGAETVVYTVPADKVLMIERALEYTQEAFNGTSPTLILGTGEDADGLLPSVDLTSAPGLAGFDADQGGVDLWDDTNDHTRIKPMLAGGTLRYTLGGSGATAGKAHAFFVGYIFNL